MRAEVLKFAFAMVVTLRQRGACVGAALRYHKPPGPRPRPLERIKENILRDGRVTRPSAARVICGSYKYAQYVLYVALIVFLDCQPIKPFDNPAFLKLLRDCKRERFECGGPSGRAQRTFHRAASLTCLVQSGQRHSPPPWAQLAKCTRQQHEPPPCLFKLQASSRFL